MKILKDGRIWGQINTDYHDPEYIRKQREAKLGSKNPMWKDGATAGPYVKKGYTGKWTRRTKYNPNSRVKPKGFGIGHKPTYWKGGITPLGVSIRNLLEYKQWRHKVFVRDGFACVECHGGGGRLNAHHIKPFADILEEFLQEYNQFSPYDDKDTLVRLAIKYEPFWDVDNGITLCKEFHKKIRKNINVNGG